jgi:hypothetical protein
MIPSPILPPPLPDELLTSYFERCITLNQLRSTRVMQRMALGASWRRLDLALPTHLACFSNLFSERIPSYDLEDWIGLHTFFPYYASVLKELKRDVLWNRMLHAPPGPIRTTRPVAGLDEFKLARRYCPECEEQDSRSYGISYLHRSAHLPLVSRCAFHQLLLTEKGFPPRIGVNLTKGVLRNSNIFSAVSAQLLHSWPLDPYLHPRVAFGLALREAGWLSLSGTVAIASLTSHIQKVFSDGFESADLTAQVKDEAAIRRWLQPIFHTQSRAHPVYCILLAACFKLESPEASTRKNRRSSANCATSHIDESKIDVVNAINTTESLTEAAKVCGLSVNTVATIARRNRIAFVERTKTVTPDMRNRIQEALTSGRTVSDICREFSVSPSTTYRILQSSPDIRTRRKKVLFQLDRANCRAEWRTSMSASPGAGVRALRDQEPAIYSWLYRNDRKWLLKNLPQARSRLPATREKIPVDAAASLGAERLRTAAVEIAAHPGRPQKLSENRLALAAGITGTLHDRLKRNIAYYKALLESKDSEFSYVRKRLFWAEHVLNQEFRSAKRWAVRRASGLRESTIERGLTSKPLSDSHCEK